MNKKFLFALVATAGLFASCTDDDLQKAPQRDALVNDSEAAKIVLNIANPGSTRGTGVVGSTEAAQNKWAGQTFNLFMFEKRFTEVEGVKKYYQTFIPTKQGDNDIYNNAVITTPTDGTTAGKYIVNDEEQYNYYPASGASSFWAYRIDDAGTGDDGVGVPTGLGSEDSDDAEQVLVPFKIDGSQDLMVGIADTATALTNLQAYNTAHNETAAGMDRIFDAYAARRGIQPTLKFKHLLTRLTFKVKAASIEVSDKAEKPASITNDPANPYIKGVRVDSIKVKSKTKGNIIAAFKGDAANYVDEETGTAIKRITWDEEDNDPVDLSLRSRNKTPENADVKFQAVGANAPLGTQIELAGNNGTYKYGGNTTHVTTADDIVYATNETNAKGEPTGTPVTASTITEGNRYYMFVKEGTHSDGVTTWDKYYEKEDAGKQLTDKLNPVVPEWNIGELTWKSYEGEIVGYTFENSTESEYEAASNKVDLTSSDVVDDNPTSSANVNVLKEKNVAVETVIKYIASNYVPAYYKCIAVTKDIDDAAEVTDFPAEATLGKLCKKDDVYYKYTYADPSNPGGPVATPVGESLLVAPAGTEGYKVTIYYTRSILNTGGSYTNVPTSTTIDVVRKSGGEAVAFETGKSYNITVVLYADGQVTPGDADLEKWGEGDGLEDEYSSEGQN